MYQEIEDILAGVLNLNVARHIIIPMFDPVPDEVRYKFSSVVKELKRMCLFKTDEIDDKYRLIESIRCVREVYFKFVCTRCHIYSHERHFKNAFGKTCRTCHKQIGARRQQLQIDRDSVRKRRQIKKPPKGLMQSTSNDFNFLIGTKTYYEDT
jgi:hypothetical protein